MSIHINEALPVLETILQQQRLISDKLLKLVELFRREPQPIEPILRAMLKPITDGVETIHETLSQPSSQGCSGTQSEP